MWLRPLQVYGQESYQQAARNFAKYAIKEGRAVYSRGFHPYELTKTPDAPVKPRFLLL